MLVLVVGGVLFLPPEPLLVGARGSQVQHKVTPGNFSSTCLFVNGGRAEERKGSVKLQEPTRDPPTRARKTVSVYIYELFCMGELF